MSDVLGLSEDAGFNKIKGFVTFDVIRECRRFCAKEYVYDPPLILPEPPLDPLLGRNAQNPAFSCMDIKMNGV